LLAEPHQTKTDRSAAIAAPPAPAALVIQTTDINTLDKLEPGDDEYEATVASVITQLQQSAFIAVERYLAPRSTDKLAALSKLCIVVQVFLSLAVYLRMSSKAKTGSLRFAKKFNQVARHGCKQIARFVGVLRTQC